MLPGVLGSLPVEVQSRVLSLGRTVRWSRGELLFHPEDEAEALLLLLTGAVRLYRIGVGAREVTLEVHGAGDLLGVAALLEEAAYGMYAEATDDLEVLVLERGGLWRLLREEPRLNLALTEQLSRQTQQLHSRLTGLVFLEVSQRLALALLSLAEREGPWTDAGTLALRERISHQDLAHMVGSTRETVTKLLGDFRSRGLLDLGYRRIILTDRAGLEDLTHEPLR